MNKIVVALYRVLYPSSGPYISRRSVFLRRDMWLKHQGLLSVRGIHPSEFSCWTCRAFQTGDRDFYRFFAHLTPEFVCTRLSRPYRRLQRWTLLHIGVVQPTRTGVSFTISWLIILPMAPFKISREGQLSSIEPNAERSLFEDYPCTGQPHFYITSTGTSFRQIQSS